MPSNGRQKPRITWRYRLRRFIRNFETPLRLRASAHRLSTHHKHPWLALLCLFIPLPSWHFSLPEPVPFRTMMNNTALLHSRMEARNLNQMRSIPVWRWRDTPIRAVYRIYEIMAARHHIAMWQEVEYFFKQAGRLWALDQIPDPRDDDPVRYAIVTCIVEELVEAVNWRLSLGMRRNGKGIYRESNEDPFPPYVPEKGPTWTKHVPAIDLMSIADLPAEMLDSTGRLVLEPDGENPRFAKRNIVTNTGYFYTI